VLASLYPVTTVALAWLYLRERIDPAQAVGVAAALGGVVLISAG
jgi:drug/metabolite transporter (DMT)-like permease